MINIAHRGASALAPEHTFAAFDLAWSHGADYIELDVQMTRDRAIVVLHDRTLERTARGATAIGSRPVAHMTLAEIKRCEVGGWFNDAYPTRAREDYRGLEIPTLDEVFSRYGSAANYVIEVKHPRMSPGIEKKLLELIDDHDLLIGPYDVSHPILIQSFEVSTLRRISALDRRVPLVQLYGRRAEIREQRALEEAATYAVGIGPSFEDASPALISAAKGLGLLVCPYTVNSTENMKRLIGRGVDGIITDVPGRLDRVLRESRLKGHTAGVRKLAKVG